MIELDFEVDFLLQDFLRKEGLNRESRVNSWSTRPWFTAAPDSMSYETTRLLRSPEEMTYMPFSLLSMTSLSVSSRKVDKLDKGERIEEEEGEESEKEEAVVEKEETKCNISGWWIALYLGNVGDVWPKRKERERSREK